MFRIAIVTATAVLAGCVPNNTPTMVRIDGRSAGSSPALELQAKQDMAVCKGELSKAQLTAPGVYPTELMTNVYVGCMAGRGYTRAPEGTKPAVTL
ncbi:hypothetical protein [Bosea sp. (in: a-proteobacteria)]|uniref:hypothetical protein n=1 Tax=Bosea sp. (in: a-proteobacteria) TaxID=1871050 RepID=UPI003340576B